MVFRVLFALAFVVAIKATAVDFTGRWAGTTTTPTGAVVPIHLTVSEQNGVVSGHVIRGESSEVPLSDAFIRGEELAFTVKDDLVHGPTRFALKFVVFGHPLGDRQIVLKGANSTGDHQSTVELYPLRDYSLRTNGIDIGPVPVQRVRPVYPDQARLENIQGTVVLRVEIEETGMASKEAIRVVRGLGHGLDEAAMECVKQWRFKPAFRKGFAVRSAATIEVAFRL